MVGLLLLIGLLLILYKIYSINQFFKTESLKFYKEIPHPSQPGVTQRKYLPTRPWYRNPIFDFIVNYFIVNRSPFDETIEKVEEVEPLMLGMGFGGGLVLIVADPLGIRQILMDPVWDKVKILRKTQTRTLIGDSLFFAANSPAQSQRKNLNPVFKRSKLIQLIPKFSQISNEMINKWKEIDKEIINVDPYIRSMTFNIIGNTGFGLDFNQNPEYKTTIESALAGFFRPLEFIFGSWYSQLPTKANKDLHSVTEKSKQLIRDKIIFDRDQLKDLDPHLLGFILSDRGDLTEDQIISNIFLFMLAGQETTASTIVAALYYLALNPQFQETAFQEVEKVLSKDDIEMNEEKWNQLILVEAIIRETMRLTTTVPVFSIRYCTEDTVLLGYKIPKGTIASINTIAAHHSSKHWEDPKEFRPSRFMGEERKLNLHRIYGFSAGARMCLGHKFAIYEATTTLALILFNYTWTLNPNFQWKSKITSFNRQSREGLPLLLKRRSQ